MNNVNYNYQFQKPYISSYSELLSNFFIKIAAVVQAVIAKIGQIDFSFQKKGEKQENLDVIIQLHKDFPCLSIQKIKDIFTESINDGYFCIENMTLDEKIANIKVKLKEDIKNIIDNLGILENDPISMEANYNIKNYLVSKIEENDFRPFDLSKLFLNYLETHPDCKYAIRFLSRIHQNRINEPMWIRSFLNETTISLAEIANKNRIVEPSLTPRDTFRTPTEIVTDLLGYLKHISNDTYKNIEEQTKSLFLTHKTSIDEVKNLLVMIQSNFPNSKLAFKCNTLESQLMKEPIFTRLNDNIYGRVFDSAFVMELVNNPPIEVLEAMNTMSQVLADYLENLPISDKQHSDIARKIGWSLRKGDPRFWFPAIHKLKKLQNNDKESDKLLDLIEYLKTPKTTGHECISVIYLVNKISLLLKSYKISPPWMQKADDFHRSYIAPEVWCSREIRQSKTPMNVTGIGITNSYQPSIGDKTWMDPSERPSTARKPIFDKIKKTLNIQLQQGIPWGSGISGSANIALHAWENFNRKYTTIDPKSTLLGVIMFLCYDGGHSIHEALWTANKLNSSLQFNGDFGLGVKNSEGFISNYELFTNMYEGTLKNNVKDSFEKAFEKVIEYYNTYSIYQ